MAHVDIGVAQTKSGWKAVIKAVGPNGEVDEFEKDGYESQEAAAAAAREAVSGWMLDCGLTGHTVPLTQGVPSGHVLNKGD